MAPKWVGEGRLSADLLDVEACVPLSGRGLSRSLGLCCVVACEILAS